MLKKLRMMTSLLLVLTLIVLAFGPTSANAATIGTSGDKKEAQVIYRAAGSSISENMRESLLGYSIPVKENTELKIVKAKNEEGTILYATTREGALVTQSTLMAIGDDGKLKSFTAEDVVAASSNLDGENSVVNPFNDSLQITFAVSFYAYYYGSDHRGILQPQTAMFIYQDPNNLYTINRLIMNYDCYGHLEDFDGTNIDPDDIEWDDVFKYTITKSQNNPARNTYYSNTKDFRQQHPGKAMVMLYEADSMQEVVYRLVGVRNSTGAAIDITRYVFLNTW